MRFRESINNQYRAICCERNVQWPSPILTPRDLAIYRTSKWTTARRITCVEDINTKGELIELSRGASDGTKALRRGQDS